MEYIAFFCAISHEHVDYLENTLKEYDIGAYLIGLEISKEAHLETDGQHFHYVVQMSEKDYHKYCKRVFVDKFNLRGKALKDKPRQYGKVKKIENLDKMCSYTIKDGMYRTNMSSQQIETYLQNSFKKKEEVDKKDIIFKYLDDNWITNNYVELYHLDNTVVLNEYKVCACLLIQYFRENNEPRRKTKLESLIVEYLGKKIWTVEDEYKYFFSKY